MIFSHTDSIILTES